MLSFQPYRQIHTHTFFSSNQLLERKCGAFRTTPFDATFLPLPTKLVIPCNPPPSPPSTQLYIFPRQKTPNATSISKDLINLYDSTPSSILLHRDSPYHSERRASTPHPCFRLVAKTSAACIFCYTVFPTRIDKPALQHRSRKENIFTFGIFFLHSSPAKPLNLLTAISLSQTFFFYLFHFNPKNLPFLPANLPIFSHIYAVLSLHYFRASKSAKFSYRDIGWIHAVAITFAGAFTSHSRWE